MSGGHFSYDQYKIGYIAESIESIIRKNGVLKYKEDKYPWDESDAKYYDFDLKVIQKFQEAIVTLKMAEVYAQRIDWFISGDDGEETFFKRLEEDLKEVSSKYTQEYFDSLK